MNKIEDIGSANTNILNRVSSQTTFNITSRPNSGLNYCKNTIPSKSQRNGGDQQNSNLGRSNQLKSNDAKRAILSK